MVSAHDFFILGDHAAARQFVASALHSEGFSVTATPSGGLLAKRGSTAATVWLGAMAGKNFEVTFTVDFMVDAQGRLVARLNRGMAAGALKGGVLGAAKTDAAFKDTANGIAAALQSAGVLSASAPQN